jgi:hypothetical protein
LYWQEELLARFVSAVPSAELAFERVELLRVCELHGAELAADTEALSQRCRGAVPQHRLRPPRDGPPGRQLSPGAVVLSGVSSG